MAIEKSKDEELSKKSEESKNKEGNQEEMMSMSQVKALIKEETDKIRQASSSADMATEIAKAISQANAYNQKEERFDEFQYLSPREVEEDEILEEAVTFWTLGTLFVLGDDRRRGMPVKAPYGTIVFKPVGAKRQQNGKETEIQVIATYDCWYKKEVEWLREHTLYGSRFSERGDELFDVDIKKATKVAKYVQGMMATHASQVISMAKNMNLPITDNIDHLRIAIAQKKAEEDISKWEESQKVSMNDQRKEQLMIENKPG